MAYQRTNLIARRGYSGQSGLGGIGSVLSDFFDKLKSGASSVVDFYGQSQQQAGANAALQAQLAAQNAAHYPAPAAGGIGGISTTTLVVGGAAVVGLVLLLRRK